MIESFLITYVNYVRYFNNVNVNYVRNELMFITYFIISLVKHVLIKFDWVKYNMYYNLLH